MGIRHREDSLAAMRANQPTPQQAMLSENSETCRNIIEHEFKSAVKRDGLQPYRMNDDDQKNLTGYNTMIIMGLLQDPTGESLPLFDWKNAAQTKCEPDWHFPQIAGLFKQFGAWKTLVLRRQDEIKERILKAKTDSQLNKIKIDYSDLLNFEGGGDNE
jgi:hypothetical protein